MSGLYSRRSRYAAAAPDVGTSMITRGVNHFLYAFAVASAIACNSATRGSGGEDNVAQAASVSASIDAATWWRKSLGLIYAPSFPSPSVYALACTSTHRH